MSEHRGEIGSDDTASSNEKGVEVPFRVDERFQVQGHLHSTRTADAHQAIDTAEADSVLLWTLRHPLQPRSEASARFTRRIENIMTSNVATPKIRLYGVDPDGKAFVTTEFVYGKPVTASRGASAEQQRRFLESLESLAELHARGIVLGTICDSTFIVGGGGRVLIQGLLGDFETEASGTTMLPNVETMIYLAPEQRSGGPATPAADIFSFGLYAYRLFAGRHISRDTGPLSNPDEAIATAPAPSAVGKDVPLWVDAVLARCLETDSSNRFTDAQELLSVVQESMANNSVPASASRWAQRTVMVRPDTVGTLRQAASDADTPERHDGSARSREAAPLPAVPMQDELVRYDDKPGVRPLKLLLTMLVSVVLGVGAVGGYFYLQKPKDAPAVSNLAREMGLHEEAASAELRLPIQDMKSASTSLARKKQALRTIAESEDPVAYPILVSAIRGAPGSELRTAAAQLVVERLRRQGLLRASAVLAKWFATIEQANMNPATSPAYTHLLTSLDKTLPLDARRFALSKANSFEPVVSLQIAAALALDEESQDHFLPVLREFLSEDFSMDELRHRSVGALVLSNRTLALAFEEDVASDLSTFSSGDLAWVLIRLSDSENTLLFDVAAETLRRKIVPPYQAIFLETLVDADRFNLPQPVRRSLARGARGEMEEQDVVNLGRWTSKDAERVLLATAAIASDETVGLAAFDTLSARSLETEPAKSLVAWVKRAYWDYREKLVKPIGMLGNIEIATPEQIDFAFEKLMPFASGGKLVRVMINTSNDLLLEKTLARIGEMAPVEEITPLLTHESKDVRIAAIRALKGHNELKVLQAVYRAFDREEDAEVKQVYLDMHWVTRNRDAALPENQAAITGDALAIDSESGEASDTRPLPVDGAVAAEDKPSGE